MAQGVPAHCRVGGLHGTRLHDGHHLCSRPGLLVWRIHSCLAFWWLGFRPGQSSFVENIDQPPLLDQIWGKGCPRRVPFQGRPPLSFPGGLTQQAWLGGR